MWPFQCSSLFGIQRNKYGILIVTIFSTMADENPLLLSAENRYSQVHSNQFNERNSTWKNAKAEFKMWSYLALPAALTSMFNCSLTLTDAAILGHLSYDPIYPNGTSTDFLSAVSLGYSWIYALNIIIFAGLASAISVLSSQAFGAQNFRRATQIYFAGLLCSFAVCLPLGVGIYYTADIVHFILPSTTNELRYHLIQDFARVMLITLPSQTLASCTSTFLNSANVVSAPLHVAVFSAIINLIFNVCFVHGIPSWGIHGFGFQGSPISTVATNCIRSIILFLYLIFGNGSKEHKRSSAYIRRFLSCKSSNENTCCGDRELYSTFISQAAPLALGGAFEEWQIQVVGFFAGALGPISTASNNGMQQIFVTLSSLNYGIMTATTVRVGFYLGEGTPKKSKSVAIIAFATSLVCGLLIGTCFILFRTSMGKIFSIDAGVIELSSTLCWIVGPTYILLSMFFVSVATLQGQNRSGVLAVCFLIGAWLVSVPAAYYFAFVLNLDLPGIWYGLVLGYGTIMILTSIAVCRSKWADIAKEAVKVNRLKEKESRISNHVGGTAIGNFVERHTNA